MVKFKMKLPNMTIKFNWTCPYCNGGATITASNYSQRMHYFDNARLCLKTSVIICPNDECQEYTIEGVLSGANEQTWLLRPNSLAKQFPTYIPKAIIADYEEACLIKDLSPKASATLSRRCLQGAIRDFWSIKKGRLIDEINAIQDKIDPMTWEAINSVRNIGNIGAHMEKDINLIIDVEPKEAQLLINLIEFLIKDWYISKHERQKNSKEIINVANKKKEVKKSNN